MGTHYSQSGKQDSLVYWGTQLPLNSGQTCGLPCGSTPATQHPDFVPASSPKGLNTSLDQCPKGTFNQLRCLAYKSYSLCITQICPHLFEEKKDMSTLVQNVIEKK